MWLAFSVAARSPRSFVRTESRPLAPVRITAADDRHRSRAERFASTCVFVRRHLRSDFGNRKQTTALLIPKLAGAVDGKDNQETGTLICSNCH